MLTSAPSQNSTVIDLSFEVVKSVSQQTMAYTKECSGSRSDCCTRTCTRIVDDNSSFEAWEQYLEINAGVLQY